MLTLTVFVPPLLATLLTHRCKLLDAQDPNSVFGLPFESVKFATSDGLVLDGWFIPQRDAGRTIIICHGAGANKGNFVWFVGILAHRGYNLLIFDFRAHGSSEGRTTTYGIREKLDVRAAVDWLKQERPRQARTIVVLGSSLGAMAAALAAADDIRIDGLVLDSPFIGPYELATHHARRMPLLGPLFVDLVLAAMSAETRTDFFSPSAEQAVRQIGRRPVMVIHGDADFVMPASHARRLYEAASGPRRLWFGPGPHSNIITTEPENYANHVFVFLNHHLGTPVEP
jgi:pimeloyl-ACP methyl ester carboxylesterase